MPKGEHLGELELIVLLALIRLGDEAYGMRVRSEIAERTGRELSIGAVYSTLDRLQRKGLVTSQIGEPSPERGGRAKKIFRPTAAGEAAIGRAQSALARMLAGLGPEWSRW